MYGTVSRSINSVEYSIEINTEYSVEQQKFQNTVVKKEKKKSQYNTAGGFEPVL